MSIDWLNVGKIVNTHGIRGELKVISRTDFPEERFRPGSLLTLMNEETGQAVEAEVASARMHKDAYIVKFKPWDNINQVEQYKGWLLKVSKDERIELDEGEYYYHEIIGCRVVSEEGETIGTIEEILAPGANDVWVVRRPGAKPAYIPYIDDVVRQVDVAGKKVTIRLMEGLL